MNILTRNSVRYKRGHLSQKVELFGTDSRLTQGRLTMWWIWTHWNWHKMALILPTFSNSFSYMKIVVFWFKYHWNFPLPVTNKPTLVPWWRHQMETFPALLAICAGNSPVSGEFPAQRPVTRSFDVFFDLCPNKRLSKQSWSWWFETPSGSLWRHSNADNVPGVYSLSNSSKQ